MNTSAFVLAASTMYPVLGPVPWDDASDWCMERMADDEDLWMEDSVVFSNDEPLYIILTADERDEYMLTGVIPEKISTAIDG